MERSKTEDKEELHVAINYEDVERSKTVDKEQLHVAIDVLLKRDRSISKYHKDDVFIQEDSSEESVSRDSSS